MTSSQKQNAAERLRVALDLFAAGVEIMRQNIRRRFPEADDAEIQRKLIAWLQTRPGAEWGDVSGPDVKRRQEFT